MTDHHSLFPQPVKCGQEDAAQNLLDVLAALRGRQQRGERMTRHCLAGYRGHIHNYICGGDGIGDMSLAQLTAAPSATFEIGFATWA